MEPSLCKVNIQRSVYQSGLLSYLYEKTGPVNMYDHADGYHS